jgi:hypothetical protein
VPNPLQRAQIVLVVVAVLVGASAAFLVNADGAQAGLVGFSAVCGVLAVLLPMLGGRLKLGPMEADLREDVAHQIVEAGQAEGIDGETLERVASAAAEAVANRLPPASASAGIMVCANCGVIAALEAPPIQHPADGLWRAGPNCRGCFGSTFKLPE